MALGVQQDVLRLQVPVDDVEGVQVTQSAGNFRGVKPGSGFQKAAFPLQVVEQLQRRQKHKQRTSVIETSAEETLQHQKDKTQYK